MLFSLCLSVTGLIGLAAAQTPTSNTATDTAAIAAAQATASTNVDTSHVYGKAFDNFMIIMLENTDFSDALIDRITLTNYFGVTHPSEPNYIAMAGGEYFGMNDDKFRAVASNVSTMVDLLEERRITWSAYQEDLPYTGFEGFQYKVTPTENAYVRKHNPFVIYNSIEDVPDRLSNIKNLTEFSKELADDKLPQYMFITPNEINDGHDTDIHFAGAWTRQFLEPLLDSKKFNKKTLVLITVDENESGRAPNRVLGILCGSAVPPELYGTQDAAYYNHYSQISTVEANWDLQTLGRWDVGANVFDFVGKQTGDVIRAPTDITKIFNNQSYPGPLSGTVLAPYPIPNTSMVYNGRTVLPAIQDLYGDLQSATTYSDTVNIPSGFQP